MPPPLQSSDITDLRNWFNHWEGWGNLRGVHWWKHTSTDLTGIFWNVESVIGVSTEPAGVGGPTVYNRGEVAVARNRCVRARNHGLVNLVRLDWKPNHAVPTDGRFLDSWKEHFALAVNALKDVATIFIVGNEPNIEPDGEQDEYHGITSHQYADAFRDLYAEKVPGTMYLAAGPAFCALSNPEGQTSEIDTDWLESASNRIFERDGKRGNLDGWALHTYGSPYLPYASGGALCDSATVECPIDEDDDRDSRLVDDAGFRRYRKYIDKIRGNWADKPVYLTETNTQGYNAKYYDPAWPADQQAKGPPSVHYVAGWNQTAYQEIRSFNFDKNPERADYPPVLCLCWFVDDDRSAEWGATEWDEHALSNGSTHSKLQQARDDFKASDTSTGIVEVESALGPATAELPAGVTRLAPFIG